jgi:hypothetical protein
MFMSIATSAGAMLATFLIVGLVGLPDTRPVLFIAAVGAAIFMPVVRWIDRNWVEPDDALDG